MKDMNDVTEQGFLKEIGDVQSLKIDVPFASGIDVDKLIEGDKDPLFVTIEALNPQVSGNRNIWTEELIENVAAQILEKRPDAYQGHIKREHRGDVSPRAQTIWLGALVKHVAGKPRLFIKGYVLPYAKELKQYLKASKAAGKKVAVSVSGQAFQKWNSLKKAYNMLSFDLESIDWARPSSEGVAGLGFLGLASEMKKGDSIMERTELLRSVTVSEMKDNCPTIVQEIADEAVAETKKTVISEMQKDIDTANEKVGEYNSLLPDSVEDKPKVIKEMLASHESLMESYLDGALEKRVKSSSVRSIIRKQVVSEMVNEMRTKELVDKSIDKVMESEEVKGIVKEMQSQTVINPGVDNRHSDTGSRFIKK